MLLEVKDTTDEKNIQCGILLLIYAVIVVIQYIFLLDTIENSIDHAAGNVEEGTEQLVKAASYQRKYRKKLLILVIVAIVIAAILIGILVAELKK